MIKFLLLMLVSFSVYAEDFRTPVTLPACDVNNPEVAIIDTSAQFSQVNDSNKNIFCIKPGNYNSDFKMTRSGTEEKPRYLIYFSENDSNLHPVHMSEGMRATVPNVWFLGVRHWITDRIHVKNDIANAAVRMQRRLPYNPSWPFDTNHIVVNKYLVEGSGSGAGAVALGGHDLVVQDSVVRNTKVTRFQDDHCMVMYGRNNKIVHNEIYNCAGDGIQMSPAFSFGGVVAHNEIYATPEIRTDGNGNYDINGDFLCTETAIAIKAAGTANEPVLVKGNLMYGYDRKDDRTCATGGGGHIAFLVQFEARYITFEDNIILNSEYGVIAAVAWAKDIKFVNNLFSDVDIAFEMPQNKSFDNSYIDNKLHNVRLLFNSDPNPNDLQSGNGELVGQRCFTIKHITDPTEVCVNPSTVPEPDPIPDPIPDPVPDPVPDPEPVPNTDAEVIVEKILELRDLLDAYSEGNQ